MKKLWGTYLLFIPLLWSLLSGCGGGGSSNHNDSNSAGSTPTHFVMPARYATESADPTAGIIPEGSDVKFYFIALNQFNAFMAGEERFVALGSFKGKTGASGSDIVYNIDNALNDRECVVVSLTILDPAYTQFDLVGLMKDNLRTVTDSGKVVLGYTSDSQSKQAKPYRLSRAGGLVDSFNLMDMRSLPSVFPNPTHVILPNYYGTSPDFRTYELIPAERKVKVYAVQLGNLIQALGGAAAFQSEAQASGITTAGDSSDVILFAGDTLNQRKFVMVALAILDSAYTDFDLQGKTLLDLAQVTQSGKIALGFTVDANYNPREVTLSNRGGIIGGFILIDVSVYRPQLGAALPMGIHANYLRKIERYIPK